MRSVPREVFVSPESRNRAYENIPLPIGHGQTISQPAMVFRATAALDLRGDERVLEVGAGCGYQAAILAELLPFGFVVAVERIPELVALARGNVDACGIRNVEILPAAETLGAPAHGPYDAILVSAAAPSVPGSLLDQLEPGGRLVIPVGDIDLQKLTRVTVRDGTPVARQLGDCRFVPLVGTEAWPPTTQSPLNP